jgi:deoxyribonuclease IV
MENIIKSILEDIIINVIMSSKIIGAHVNREKTLKKTIEKLYKYKGNVLQIFTSNPSNCSPANLDKYIKEYESIKDLECNFVIHSSYTINIASLDPKQIKLNINTITTDLIIADKYKAIGVILHVGKYVKNDKIDCIKQMKVFMLEIIEFIKNNNLNTKIILETGAGQGTEMIVDIDEFINFSKEFDKKYFTVCFDTCHVWSAGFDIIKAYDKIIKELTISVIHFNGSKTPKGSLKDRHENLFSNINTIPIKKLTEFAKKLKNVMIILETPDESEYLTEIKYLNELIP